MNKKVIIAVVVIIIVLGIVLVGGQRGQTQRQETTSTSPELQPGQSFTIGQKAPDFALKDFDGKEVKLSDFYRQKAVVLDFWAAWCPFCVEEMPALEKAQQAYKENLVMIGVHRTDSGEAIETGKKFADERGVTYLLLQGTGEIYKASTKGLNAMPVAVFIDKNGIVQDMKFGPKTEEEIKEKVEKLL